jgi:TolB-like protein/Tfp pilus assembly protein PilF
VEKPFPAYRGSDSYIFVSYSHTDEDDVFAQIRWLQDQGINVWYDATGIGAGSEWNEEIARAIKGANRFLCFITPNSIASEHCRRELSFAQSEGRQVVVCHLQETDLPDGLRLSLENRQAILKHRLSENDYHSALVRALSSGAIQESQRARTQTPRTGTWMSLAGVALTVILIIGSAWWYLGPTLDELPAMTVASGDLAIAVMPFTNMSNDPDQEFFSDGIAEDILNELAKNRRLIVRPRASSFALKHAGLDIESLGTRLKVTHILEGSVRRSGSRIRVTAQLSDVAGNRSVWSDRYERELTDVFAVQDAIVEEIHSALNAQIGGSGADRFVPGIEAYEAFLFGRYQFNRLLFDESEHWLKVAVELDPSYAEAWAYLAQNITWRTAAGFNPSAGEHAAKRREYVETALRLDPSNATARGVWALSELLYTDRDYERSVNELIRLVTEYPNNEAGHFYLTLALGTIGKLELATKVVERYADLSPESAIAQMTRASYFIQTGTLEEARLAVQEFEARFDNPYSARMLAIQTRDIDALKKIEERGNLDVSAPVRQYFSALIPYLQGDYQGAAEKVSPLKSPDGYVPFLAQSWAALIRRDLDGSFKYYYQAVEAAEPSAIATIQQGRATLKQVFPEFYADPRYQEMLRHFGLDSESVAKMDVLSLPF